MHSTGLIRPIECWSAVLLIGCIAVAQSAPVSKLDDSGSISVDGKAVSYTIRHLPVSSFPDLPQPVSAELQSRGCLIPQTYEAHRPENVVRGRLQNASSIDWAVLCSRDGNVSLMIFFGGNAAQPAVLATSPETERLQLDTATGVYGFDWAIDIAGPQRVREAASGERSRPPVTDHDALADSVIDRRTVYHFYANKSWTLLDLPER